MTTSTRPRAVTQIVRSPPPIAHAENPSQPGFGLCGRKLSGRHASASLPLCVVCSTMIRSDWSSR